MTEKFHTPKTKLVCTDKKLLDQARTIYALVADVRRERAVKYVSKNKRVALL